MEYRVTILGSAEEDGTPKRRVTSPSHRRRVASTFWPFTLYSALLLGILCAVVVNLSPREIKNEAEDLILRHQRGQNVVMAQKLIAKLLPSPAVLWSDDFRCDHLGHGIWLVQGRVEIDSPTGQRTFPDWKVIFMPETSQPLYLSVGSIREGDYNAALIRAGVQPDNP